MASLTLQDRSDRFITTLEARLTYYPTEGKTTRRSIYAPTEIEISKPFWDYYRKKEVVAFPIKIKWGDNWKDIPKSFWKDYTEETDFRDIDKINLKEAINDHKKEIDDAIRNLKKVVLEKFKAVDTSAVSKDWLKNVIHEYYNPPQDEPTRVIPNDLLSYFEYYLKQRGTEVSQSERRRLEVTKRKLERFEKAVGKRFEIIDVNENFKRDFVEYCQSENYAHNTIKKDLDRIKQLCLHARDKEVKVSRELKKLTIKAEKTPIVYLTFAELDKIRNLSNLSDRLDNARDWLVISCYTGQRISDFMRFDKSMIRKQKGASFIDITQVKTGKAVTIPVLPEISEILQKRGGNFPKALSHQKYNDYIKEVCQLAKLNNKTKGKLAVKIEDETDSKSKKRYAMGKYEKWELVSSHIGRRSMATNFYGKIPTSYLKNITGHSTEKMFLNYIGRTSDDTAFEAYELMLNAKR